MTRRNREPIGDSPDANLKNRRVREPGPQTFEIGRDIIDMETAAEPPAQPTTTGHTATMGEDWNFMPPTTNMDADISRTETYGTDEGSDDLDLDHINKTSKHI